VVRQRLAKARSITSGSFEFTLDNRLLKLGLRGTKSLMITRPGASWLLFSLSLILLASFFFATFASGKAHRYAGRPFEDSVYHGGPQLIPGPVMCAYYDLGGEGVAYHDTDAKNNGSGALNPADGTYLNQFRMNEGVDTSYTKFHDEIDNNPYNLVLPPENLLYFGWVEPGEWFNLTVRVERSGVYTADLLYTSSGGGDIAFDVNGKQVSGPFTITSTYNASDPIAWRQMHHWALAKGFVHMRLRRGVQVLTLRVLTKGHMNFAYLDFKPEAQ
jgi:hypothetical protein